MGRRSQEHVLWGKHGSPLSYSKREEASGKVLGRYCLNNVVCITYVFIIIVSYILYLYVNYVLSMLYLCYMYIICMCHIYLMYELYIS